MDLPKPTSRPYVRVIPLGGLDQFGANSCLVECDDRLLMFDCGLSFPDTPGFGIDYILPDWTWVLDNLDRLEGIVLTHGHEDHIGALPYLLEEVEIPLWGGELTLAMVRKKLVEADIADVPYHTVQPGESVKIGPFDLSFLHVNHSIPNAMSVAIGTPLGTLLFTGDWKLDQTPVGEPVMDLQGFARLGEEGLLALLADSTNATVPGFSRSERLVTETIGEYMGEARGRLIVAQFSSNQGRLAGLIDIATRKNRKVALLGRSLNRNFDLAREHGFVSVPPNAQIIDPRDIEKTPDEELLIVSTGSQAEPRSSLTRMAYDDHHQITLKPADTVILSARVIPGNEKGIGRMRDALARRGVTVITENDDSVHGSGHAKVEEMKLLLNLTRPQYLVPVHGEFRVRRRHAALGQAVGAAPLLMNDGDVLEFTESDARIVGSVPSGRVAVDGKFLGDVDDVQIRNRRKLAATGIVFAFAVIDHANGEILDGPDLFHHGFLAGIPESEKMLTEAASYARSAIEELPEKARPDASEVREAMRLAVRRYFRKKIDRKPVVIPVVHEM